MIIRIEKASGIPVTRQILDQIRTQCATGALEPGDQLPSVRQLALELAVNQNTILRVYERLETQGLIERRHGSGTFVAHKARKKPLAAEHERLRVEAETLVRHAVSLGLGLDDVRTAVTTAYEDIANEPTEGEQE